MSSFGEGSNTPHRQGNAGTRLRGVEEETLRAALKATLDKLKDKNANRTSVRNELANIINESSRNLPPKRLAAVLNFQGRAPDNFSMLHHFAYQGFPELIEKALGAGADPRIKANSKKCYTPIFYALSENVPPEVTETTRLEIVQLLLATDKVPIDELCDNVTILHKAVYLKLPIVAQWLLDMGADPDMVMPKYRETPRGIAEENGMVLRYHRNGDVIATERSEVPTEPGESPMGSNAVAAPAPAPTAHDMSGVAQEIPGGIL